MKYRKAVSDDVYEIAKLVTDLLGSCNIESEKAILESNVEEITKDINHYFVCTINDQIIGACGISDILKQDTYHLNLKNVKEILYLVVHKKYQGRGIGTTLLKLCSKNNECDILYEAWGDNKDHVNSKFILERCGYHMLKDLGRDYYQKNNYCYKCVNRYKNCNECVAQIWIKHKSQSI